MAKLKIKATFEVESYVGEITPEKMNQIGTIVRQILAVSSPELAKYLHGIGVYHDVEVTKIKVHE